MGRAIVLFFFVVGFVVFLVIKYAAFGVKAAYLAVNEPERFNKTIGKSNESVADDVANRKLLEIIVGLLNVLVALAGGQIGSIELNTKLSDDFSIGYVFGFFDGFLQLRGTAADVNAMAIGAIVFLEVFGQDKGALLFGRALDLQSAGHGPFDTGRTVGGTDAFDFMKQKGKPTAGWSAYIYGLDVTSRKRS